MYILLTAFVIGYILITFEHNLKINKTASALITGIVCWVLLLINGTEFFSLGDLPLEFQEIWKAEGSFNGIAHFLSEHALLHHLSEIASIVFFLLGAMTIVEFMDAYGCFELITDRITTNNKVKLLYIVGVLSFFLSAMLDNLTTSIVMISLLRKLLANKNERMLFAGVVIIAANAGGAWSPIGDVTTTMLWIADKITTTNIVYKLILPSLVCLILPLLIIQFRLKGQIQRPQRSTAVRSAQEVWHQKIIFFVGVAGLVFVPIFKTLTHFPPFMGMMLSLGVLWFVSELLNSRKDEEIARANSVASIMKRIDTPSILFFFGILIAISSLDVAGILLQMAGGLNTYIGDYTLIATAIGLLSAVVDNVPIVAAVMGMYDFPTDYFFWELVAFTAGTGGSCLIIGSAAGVAVMGLEKIDFIWYLRHISFPALVGYAGGIITFVLLNS